MQLFYTPDISGNKYTLPEEESKHAIKVLRLQAKDKLQLIDGKGGFYQATVENANSKKCEITISEKQAEYNKRNFHTHIAVAPTKNIDRIEWFLEKATEIGIDEITPILCEHSERKIIKNERLEKIIISAMKQSLKAYKPKLNPLTPLTNLLQQQFNGDKFIAYCYEDGKETLKTHLNNKTNIILIGPEGDFSESEIKKAIENNFKPVSLGNSRLRTETAALVACHTCALNFEK